MKLEEYLETVSAQIRYTKVRSAITAELKNHILDQAADYEAHGISSEEALERAVGGMGDPVETGAALDRIHRPQMNWGIVIVIAVLSFFSIGVFYAANIQAHDMFPWQRQAFFVLIGFALMLVIYRLDYSILGFLGWIPCVMYLLLLFIGYLFNSVSVHGVYRWIRVGSLSISVSEAMLLYVPLFGAALYSFRGDRYKVLPKAIPLILAPVFFISRLPDLSTAVILFTCLCCLFIFAIWKDWYQISKKLITGILGGIVLLSPLVMIGYFYFFGASYQSARIRAFFTQSGDADYILSLAENIRKSSALLGSSEESLRLLVNGPTSDYLTDFILVSMCSIYGTLITIAVIAGLLLIIMKVFHISVSQKNQLGMILGTGCGLVFLVKTVVGILVNFQMLPHASISMPFLSHGGSNVIVSYLLLGLVLSIYRYKTILPENRETGRKRLRLKFMWEAR